MDPEKKLMLMLAEGNLSFCSAVDRCYFEKRCCFGSDCSVERHSESVLRKSRLD